MVNTNSYILDKHIAPMHEVAPEQAHGGQIRYESQYGKNSVLEGISRGFDEVRGDLDKAIAVRNNPHPDDTAAKHAEKVKRLVDNVGDRNSPKFDKWRADLKSEISRVEKEIDEKANLKIDPQFYNSVLDAFQKKNIGQKTAALDKLILQNDGPTLAAILGAPLLVSGLEPEQRDAFRDKMRRKTSPNELALLGDLRKAQDRIEAASIATLRTYRKLLDGTDRWDKAKAKADEIAARANHTGF